MTDYNGWTNYETWNLNLWIENDEGLYQARNEYAIATRQWSATDVCAFALEYLPNGTPDFDGNGDYALVNWDEIAHSWNTDI